MNDIDDVKRKEDPKSIVLVTGGFDPIHSGHIQYLKSAAKFGDKLIVGVNSDEWLTRKKGKPFMPIEERMALLNELLVVDEVIDFNDDDNTACAAIEKIKEMYKDVFNNKFHKKIVFCNGGDRTAENIPEQERYKTDEWVSFEFGVGGKNKKNSSSWILEDYKNAKTERNWGYYRVIHEIGKGVKVKELVIEPGQALSNQYHEKRNELWYVMKGEVVMNGVVQQEHGPAFLIPKGYWHHAINVSDKPCHILECQYGEECIEEDIIRQPLDENDSQQVNENESHYNGGTYVGLVRGQEDDGYPD